MQGPPDLADRLAIRRRPDGLPVMHQRWEMLLFMHWPMPVEALRPLIPHGLAIDTFEGMAWVGVAPFTIRDLHPPFFPPLPGISNFHEINVRTYVHLNGVPGVWFFSLDTVSLLAVLGARTFFHLPYFRAKMCLERKDRTITYSSVRRGEGTRAEFAAVWTIGPDLPSAQPGTLEFFLIERYCLYSSHKGKLFRSRIFHQPWPLQEASLSTYTSTMMEADGLPTPIGEPLLHCAGPVDVDIWSLKEVR